MNNPPDWLLSIFMGALPMLSVLAVLEIVVIIPLIVLGYIYRKRPTTQRLGRQTIKISLLLAIIALAGFFYPKLVSDFLTLNIIGRFLFPLAFYGIAIWWSWHIYSAQKLDTRTSKNL
jgi:hypothetical protein